MKCPKCSNEIKGEECKTCKKSAKELFFEYAEKEERLGNTEKALEYLYELRKNTVDKSDLADIEKRVRSIRFAKEDIRGGFSQDSGKVEKKAAGINFYTATAIVIVVLLLGFYIVTKIVESTDASNSIVDNRQLKVGFLYHFNQVTSPHADIADATCYNGLLKVLRKHKNLKFNIHIAGTLIEALNWYNPETIKLIKDGIEDGQFELVGSTYSQNVMYSTDEQSNKWQIERHKEIIKSVFNVEPKGFWNPERTWRQDLSKLILDGGYKYTFIEDHITKASGTTYPEHILRSTEKGKLLIINDDYQFMPVVNSAVDVGDEVYDVEKRGANLKMDSPEMKSIFKYLRGIYEADKDGKMIASYADDAEITGNWDFGKQKSPEWDFKNLDLILTKLENTKWIKTIKYSDEVKNENVKEDLTPINDGAASWMEIAAKDATVNWGEGEYKSWAEYNRESPKLNYYRVWHKKMVDKVLKYEKNDDPKIKKLVKLAKEGLMIFEFEFGCTGICGTRKDWEMGKRFSLWENIRHLDVIFDVMEKTLNYKDGFEERDVNNDGIKELIVLKNKNYYVFSIARGGRLLYWYDLNKGIELSGGEFSLQFGEDEYVDDNYMEKTFDLQEISRFLVASDETVKHLKTTPYAVRQKALNEILRFDGEEPTNFYYMDTKYTKLSDNEIKFVNGEYEKIVKINSDGLEVSYKMPEKVKTITVFSEFQPDYFNIMDTGITSLETKESSTMMSLFNKNSKVGVEVSFPDGSEKRIRDSLFGKILEVDLKNNSPKIVVKKVEM